MCGRCVHAPRLDASLPRLRHGALPRLGTGDQRRDPRRPGGIQIRVRRKATGDLQAGHAVSERPRSAHEIGVAAEGPHERFAGASLDPGARLWAGEWAIGHQSVQMWMGERPGTKRPQDPVDRLNVSHQHVLERARQVIEAAAMTSQFDLFLARPAWRGRGAVARGVAGWRLSSGLAWGCGGGRRPRRLRPGAACPRPPKKIANLGSPRTGGMGYHRGFL